MRLRDAAVVDPAGFVPDDAQTVDPPIRRRQEAPPMTTRTAWFNGTFVPETDVVIPYRDRSFNRGDG